MANIEKEEEKAEAKEEVEMIMPPGVIVTRCKKCKYDEFEEIEKLHTPMLKCMRCGDEMVDEFLVYGRI